LTSKGVKIVLKPFSVDDIELAIGKAFELQRILPDRDGSRMRRTVQDPTERSLMTETFLIAAFAAVLIAFVVFILVRADRPR
jgi:hypothetical protein